MSPGNAVNKGNEKLFRDAILEDGVGPDARHAKPRVPLDGAATCDVAGWFVLL